MTSNEILDILKNTSLFYNSETSIIRELLNVSTVLNVDEKKTIFFEGTPGDHFYLLLKGSVKISRTAVDGREAIIRFIEPGEIFAELILFGGKLHPADAVVIHKSLILRIPEKIFTQMLANETLREDFINSLFNRMHDLTCRIQYLSTFDVEERLLHFIKERFGEHSEYNISIPKKDIASAIGTIPVTLSRCISRLKRQGDIVDWKQKKLVLRNDYWSSKR